MKIRTRTYKRMLAVFICLCMILSLLSWIPSTYVRAAGNNITEGISRIADKDTTDEYIDKLISDENGSRYAGRLWSDKSVFSANDSTGKATISLNMDSDGINSKVTTEADFGHVFSALGSSQVENDNITLPLDVVFVLDTSSTMASNYGGIERLYQASLALNSAFDSLMENPYNRVALFTFDTNSVQALPLDHYEPLSDKKDGRGNPLYFEGSTSNVNVFTNNLISSTDSIINYSASGYKNDKFFSSEDFAKTNKYSQRLQYIQMNLKSTTNQVEYNKWISIRSGTNTHQGLYEGLNLLAQERSNKATIIGSDGERRTLQRIPVVILLSDGAPSYATTTDPVAKRGNASGYEGNTYYGEPQYTGAIKNWWAPVNKEDYVYPEAPGRFKPKLPIGERLKSDGSGDYESYYWSQNPDEGYLIGRPSDHAWGCALPLYLMAAHMKKNVNQTYFECDDSNNPIDYTGTQIISVGIDPTNQGSPAVEDLMLTTLNPKERLAAIAEKEKEEDQEPEINPNTRYTQYLYEVARKYFDDSYNIKNSVKDSIWNELVTINDEKSKGDPITEKARLEAVQTELPMNSLETTPLQIDQYHNWATIERPSETDTVNSLTWDDIYYNDEYVYGSTTDDQDHNLQKVLKDLVERLKTNNTAFTPVSGKNEIGLEDSITYVDPIGDYMEIKDKAVSYKSNSGSSVTQSDMSLLFFGQMKSVVKTGVYDYQFNEKFDAKVHNGTAIGEFRSGWYSSDNPEEAIYLGEDGSWENDNVYYVDRTYASEWVPTLDPLSDGSSPNDITDKQKNTVYTFYEFDETKENLQKWRLNPSYAGYSIQVTEKDYNKDFEIVNKDLVADPNNLPNGIYRLDDIRIWVEDTGDYKDDNPTAEGSDGLFNGVGFDQALYMDIPANALPLQIAEVEHNISLEKDGEDNYNYVLNVESYKTNLSEKAYSTPLRLFYAVGIKNDIKTENKAIDLAKVSQTYLDNHRDDNGNIFFLSNYFSAGENENSIMNQGDPVVTFSPGIDNRYYVFQKALPIYTQAYQYDGNNWNPINNRDWNGHELLGTFENLSDPLLAEENPKKDDVIFLKENAVRNGLTGQSEEVFFFAIDYFKGNNSKASNSEQVRYVLARTGAELLAETYEKLDHNTMLCWIDLDATQDNSVLYQPYNEGEAPSEEGNWVLATRPGGLRVTDLLNDSKEINETNTASDSYYPTLVAPENAGNEVILRSYLGNNGRLTVDDSLLLVTKLVEDKNGQINLNDKTPFSFDVYIQDFTGERKAIRTEWNNDAKAWFRRISTISAVTDNNGLLHEKDNQDKLAKCTIGDANYYVYIPDSNSVIGSTVVYSAPENSEDQNTTIGRREWTTEPETGDTVESFIAPVVYFIPVSEVDNQPEWTFNIDKDYSSSNDFVIATMAITGENLEHSEVDIQSDYYIRTEYLTTPVDFGDNKKDPINTASFSLSSGEGLLFNSIENNGRYDVIEQITDEQENLGYEFKSINEQSESSIGNTNPKYSINHKYKAYEISGTTGQSEATANFINLNNNIQTAGNLTITKTVTGSTGETDKAFDFTVELGNKDIQGTYGDLTFSDGLAEIPLKNGESKTATNLPAGTTYTVIEKEADQDGYTTSSTGASGTIVANTTVTAAFVNSRGDQTEPNGISVEKYHKFSHQKEESYHTGLNEVQSKDTIDYKIVVSNNSDETYKGVKVIDPVPQFLSVNKNTVKSLFTPTTRTITEGYDEKTHQVSWMIGDLASGEKVDLYFSVNVPEVSSETYWINHAHLTYESVESVTPVSDLELTEIEDNNMADETQAVPEETLSALAVSQQSYGKHQSKETSGSNQNNTYHSPDLFENNNETPNLYTADVVEHLKAQNTPAPSTGKPQLYKEQSLNNGNKTTGTLTVNSGDIITYFLNVTNTTGSVMTNVEISDVIPANLIYQEGQISEGGRYSARTNTVTWNIDRLEVNSTATVWFKVQVPSATQNMTYINDFSMNYRENTTGKAYVSNEVIANQTYSNSSKGPNLTIQKKQSVKRNNPDNYSEPNDGQITTDYIEVRENDIVTYYIYVTNTGNEAAYNIVITDPVPDGLIFVQNSATQSNIMTQNGNILTWNISSLQPGESSQVQVQFKVVVPEINSEIYWKNIAFVSHDGNNSPIPSNQVVIGDPPVNPENPGSTNVTTPSPGTNNSNGTNNNGNVTAATTSTVEPTNSKVSTVTTGVTSTGVSPQTGVTGGIGIFTLTGIGAAVGLYREIKRKKKIDKE